MSYGLCQLRCIVTRSTFQIEKLINKIFIRFKKKCYVSDFPTDWSKYAPTATFLALRKKKKKKSLRPTLFNDSGFYQKSKPFRYENLSAPIFGYFRSLTFTSRTTIWLLCSVLTRPSTLVAIYFDKCSHNTCFKCNKSRAAQCPI